MNTAFLHIGSETGPATYLGPGLNLGLGVGSIGRIGRIGRIGLKSGLHHG
jgi:hypothetical protein